MSKNKPKRKYSERTLKALYGLSKVCAYPGCESPLVTENTEGSNFVITGQICHIHAIRSDGPRGKVELTEKERNSLENLILLCGYHHDLVDGLPDIYTAEVLRKWKNNQKSNSTNLSSGNIGDIQSYYPTKLINKQIEDETKLLRKSRFFPEFNKTLSSLTLAGKLVNGDFSSGSDAVKCKSLAWCVRLLVDTEHRDKAKEYLKIAMELDTCPEIRIADAFMSSKRGDKDTALSILANIDSPLSRSAALMIVTHHECMRKAIDWMKSAEIDVTNLDSDGKLVFLTHHLSLAQWETAQKILTTLADDDFLNTPFLLRAVAITHLLSVVPDEGRSVVLSQVPFDVGNFPLASNETAIHTRELAHKHFVDATKAAQQLDCPQAAKIDDEYALWLEITDPYDPGPGKARLGDMLFNHRPALHLVRLGLQFGMELNLEGIEREIEREISLNGKITSDAAIARLALAFVQGTPKDGANYIIRHLDDLSPHIDEKALHSIRISMLSQAGLYEQANKCLEDMLVKEKLSDAEKKRFRTMIAKSKGSAPVDDRKELFRKTDSLGDLTNLVEELGKRGDWDEACQYGEILFRKTLSPNNAERFVIALYNAHKYNILIEFLESEKVFVGQSEKLNMLFCWSLYAEGRFLEARSKLTESPDDRDRQYYRELQINLAISLGDWNSLPALVENEFEKKDERNAQELLHVAQLASHLNLPRAKDLTVVAANKSDADANVLAGAYLLACNAGWEDNEETFQWIEKATMLSGESGPIHKITLKDFWNQKPERDRRESEIWQKLSVGDIPMSLAAQYLNKSLIDLMLSPGLVNLSENDPRRRGAILAYSGNREPLSPDVNKKIGIDATALLTLSFLGLLDDALDLFETVYIPHSTLSWLFFEKQKISFHQPSQIRDAKLVRGLLATGSLEKLSPNTVPDSDLSNQVGEDLALLIAEAEKAGNEDNSQCIVVVPFPVYRVSSLMEEMVDLTAHETVLSGCASIVSKLREKGQITATEEEKARTDLQLREQPWPNQPQIADGATLYLDDLAVTYFLHLGLLEKLHSAGFKSIVSPVKTTEIDALLSYEKISAKIHDIIEHIRSAINSRIESGKIKVGGQTRTNKPAENLIYEYPIFDIFSITKYCDGIVVDDRCINQHPNIEDHNTEDRLVPTFSTLDIIDALVFAEDKTDKERMEYRTSLRSAGYFFIPVSADELINHLEGSVSEDGKFTETAELKAIRENILCARMNNYLQFPKEISWLEELFRVFIRVLQTLWRDDADFTSARARSNWIVSQIDCRGWAHSFDKENRDNIVKVEFGKYISMLIWLSADKSQEVQSEYWNWIEEKVLIPIKEQYPDLYSHILELQREQIERISEINPSEEK